MAMAMGMGMGITTPVASLLKKSTNVLLQEPTLPPSVTVSSLNTNSPLSTSLLFSNDDNIRVRHILCGHEDQVNSVAMSTEFDILVSGLKDKTVMIHTLIKGKYVKSLYHPSSVDLVAISKKGPGYIVAFCCEGSHLFSYSTNGKLLSTCKVPVKVNSILLTDDGRFLILGGESILVVHTHSLEFLHTYESSSRILSLALVHKKLHLLASLEDGRISIFPFSTKNWEESRI